MCFVGSKEDAAKTDVQRLEMETDSCWLDGHLCYEPMASVCKQKKMFCNDKAIGGCRLFIWFTRLETQKTGLKAVSLSLQLAGMG